MKRLFFLTFFIVAALAACRKDSEFSETSRTEVPIPKVYVKTSIGGTVIDEQNRPVADAKVFLADKTATTDKNGVFLFKNVIVNSKAAYVRVERDGFFHGSRTILVASGTLNTVKIQLLAKNDTRQLKGKSGGKADFKNFSIELPAGGVVNSSGETHDDGFEVVAKWLDPTSENFAFQMPGDLRGVTLDGNLSGMVSMGMLAVELLDFDGRKLQVKKGFEASMRMRVPDALLSKAPATIPLWYFDEAAGIWREEGEARLVGNFYEGKVAHFSFWNHDYKDPLVEIKFTVVDGQGNPIPNALISTKLLSSGLYGAGYTDNMGCILGLVPKDEVLQAQVFAPNIGCNDALLTTQIGPFSQNSSHTFTINVPSLFTYTITGHLVDCAGNAVLNGYAKVDSSSALAWVDANGDFTWTIVRCTSLDVVEVVGFDIPNLKQSLPKTVAVVNNGSVDAGTIEVCDALQEYFVYNWFDGTNQTYTSPGARCSSLDSIPGGGLDAVWIQNVNTSGFYAGFNVKNVTGVGTYTTQYFNIEGQWQGQDIFHSCPQQNTCISVQITEFNGVGGYIAGTYSGEPTKWNSQPSVNITVTGSFRGILK